ncbi:MAG: hypothetical protein ACXIVO_03695 [Glycocaulis sp.]
MAIKIAKDTKCETERRESPWTLFDLAAFSAPKKDRKKFANRDRKFCDKCRMGIFTAKQKSNHILEFDTPDGDVEHNCSNKPMHQIHEENFQKDLIYFDFWHEAEILYIKPEGFSYKAAVRFNNKKKNIYFNAIYGPAAKCLHICTNYRAIRFLDESKNIIFCGFNEGLFNKGRGHNLNITVSLANGMDASGVVEVWAEGRYACLIIAQKNLRESGAEFSYVSHEAFDIYSSDYIYARSISSNGMTFFSDRLKLRRRSKPYTLLLRGAR